MSSSVVLAQYKCSGLTMVFSSEPVAVSPCWLFVAYLQMHLCLEDLCETGRDPH